MGSNENNKKTPATIYNGEKAYFEIDMKKLQETGEIQPIGEIIYADNVTKKLGRKDFYITYLLELFELRKCN
ncbi:MAG: hypothetical protein LBK29_03780 [Oscillospiraceae bacterium]|jgi:hypothetical protein|nr:hypothetical protein [Oscillospiraceae bacterium]